MTDQKKGQVLLLEVVVLFSFLMSFMMPSPLIGAILRVHNCTFRIVFLCFGCVSHNYNWGPVDMEVILTLCQHETMGAFSSSSPPWSQWRGAARDQEPAAWSASEQTAGLTLVTASNLLQT